MIVTTQQNDTIDRICWRYFGSTASITERVLALNPHLKNRNPILPIGLQITLPDAHIPVPRSINLWN